MQPLNDDELKDLLRAWRAPRAPDHLKTMLFAPRPRGWRRLLTASVTVPVPVLLLALILLTTLFYFARKPARAVSLADFQPAKELNVRVIRSNYEQH
ncbi:MAG: hypothetical protein JWN34_2326 [Bryobacterales bacterium]|jgi:hypothetical protein|nr:hypothetical protein [Bryobacterales bacterium]